MRFKSQFSRAKPFMVVRKADDEIKPVIEATFLTGCAIGELRRMTVADYDPEHGTVLVYNSKRRTRNVPLTDEGAALFDELTAGRPGDAPIFTNDGGDLLPKSYHSRRVIEACRAANVSPPVTLTQIRKTYGSILLNKEIRDVIDTEEFQRLRGVRQLGPTLFVFPGANHTRFEHSLGTYHLSLRYLERLLDLPDFRKSEKSMAKGIKFIVLAALLHDIGHYPYSHWIEEIDVFPNSVPPISN